MAAVSQSKSKPTVLIIGDSISMYYTPTAERLLADEFAVVRNEGNARHSRNILAKLDDYLGQAPDAVLVHFNCGLHDLLLPPDGIGHQVPLQEYQENLKQIVRRLQATGKTLVWARTTPVNDVHPSAAQGHGRCQAAVDAYNAAADKIMAAAGIALDDLHAAIMAAGKAQCLKEDGVHLTDAAYSMLGEQVARAIRSAAGS